MSQLGWKRAGTDLAKFLWLKLPASKLSKLQLTIHLGISLETLTEHAVPIEGCPGYVPSDHLSIQGPDTLETIARTKEA